MNEILITAITAIAALAVGSIVGLVVRRKEASARRHPLMGAVVNPGTTTVALSEGVAITDGTNLAAVKGANTAPLATDAALVVTISPNSAGGGGGGGGGTVAQGTAAALAGAWPVEITDGTSVLGTSGHPVRTDPTGTTTQPVSGNVGTTATAAAPLPVQLSQGGAVLGTSNGVPVVLVDNAGHTAPAGDVAARAFFEKITDGTNTAAVKAGSTAAVATDPAVVTSLSPNSPLPAGANAVGTVGVTSLPALPAGGNAIGSVAQGTASALAGAWPVIPTDGTRQVAIKAGSTAAAAGDTSEVVALSPNSPLPAGANAIGSVTVTGTPAVTLATLPAPAAPSFAANFGAVSGNIKNAAGKVFAFQATNRAGAAVYFQLFNLAASPAGGASAFASFLVPPGGEIIIGQDFFTAAGVALGTGISFGFSTATNGTYTAATPANCDSHVVYS